MIFAVFFNSAADKDIRPSVSLKTDGYTYRDFVSVSRFGVHIGSESANSKKTGPGFGSSSETLGKGRGEKGLNIDVSRRYDVTKYDAMISTK